MGKGKKLMAIVLGATIVLSTVTYSRAIASTGGLAQTKALVSTNEKFFDMAMSPGATPNEINFNWYSNESNVVPKVQIAVATASTGGVFPEDKASTFSGGTAIGNSGYTSNKVATTGLKANTKYVYRIGDGTNWGQMGSFTTGDPNSYSILFAGDPQIGASGNIAKDAATWSTSLDKMTAAFPGSSFMISVGDQVNNGNELNGQSNELEYSGYFSPTEFKSIPVAAIAGNHETYGVGHNTHFYAPNLSSNLGAVSAAQTTGTDYYFVYGNALYLMLNSNDMNEAEHKQFIEEAISKNPQVKWKIAVLHHSVYSSANHETDDDIVARRNSLPEIFDSLGIDVVLDGHDHCYTRTYEMQGGQPVKNQTINSKGEVVNPKGILYVTANSASGSKYYEIRYPGVNNYYEAVKEQIHTPEISRITITSDKFTIATYRTDTMAQTDSYTIVKKDTSTGGNTTSNTTNTTTVQPVAANTTNTVAVNSTAAVKNENLPKTGSFLDFALLVFSGVVFIGSGFFIFVKGKR